MLTHQRADATAQPTRPSHLTCYVVMELFDAAVLAAAGVAASAVNALAGGGSLITFPTLVALGMPPLAANVTNSVAVSPGYLSGAVASRDGVREVMRRRGRAQVVALAPVAAAGTVAGCVLLLSTPPEAFDVAAPLLVLASTATLAVPQRWRDALGRRRAGGGREREGTRGTQSHPPARRTGMWPVSVVVGLTAVYGGYFGAAFGVLLVALLALVLDEPFGRLNALKNAVSAVVGVVTVLAYAVFGPVQWGVVAVLLPATLVGGYGGARFASRLSATASRAVVVVVGLVAGTLLLARAVLG